MTFRASLARYLKGVLEETSPPTSSPPPPPNPASTPTTTTESTTTSAISEAGTLAVVLETLARMQTEQLRETREMVLSILQGRPMDPEQMAARPEPQPLRTPYDPPDYDHPGIEDLPGALQSVFEREDQEQHTLRTLRTEREVLSQQLDQARAALQDPQGPASGLFLSTD